MGFDELQPSSEGLDNEDDPDDEGEDEAPPKKVIYCYYSILFQSK